jgi:hypothetical protein
MGQASLDQVKLNRQIYDDYRTQDAPWMKDLANRAIGISESNAARAGELSDYQLGQMKFNDQRYRDVAIPFEDKLLEDVNRFDSAGYKNQQIASALGDVQQQFSQASEQQRRGLSRMGVNPNSGKALAANSGMGMAQAKAMADAANKTRMAADQVGLSSKMQLYGGMKGLAGLGATNAGLATGAIGAGNSSGMGVTSGGSSYLNANNAATGVMNSGVSSGLSSYGNYVGLQQNAANINNSNDPFNTILGAASAYGMKTLMASDRRLKTDIKAVGVTDSGLTVYTYRYKAGGPVMMGVMADEVAKLAPQAYAPGAANGFDAVDYSKL